jgi:superfamily II DNA or RNA helicase
VSDATEIDLRAICMKILMQYSVEQAIKDGIIAEYRIFVHYIPLDRTKKFLDKKKKLVTEYDKYKAYSYVIEQMNMQGRDPGFLLIHRNRILQNSHSKLLKTLSLLKEIEGKRTLVFTGLKKVAESLHIPYFHSTSEDKEVFENFRTGVIDKMAVVNMGRSGVTFQNLECIIIQSFTGHEETTEQI